MIEEIEKLNKTHIGKTLFAIPHGNIARRNKKPTYVPVEIISVGKVYARISESKGDKSGEQYNIEDNCFRADCNSGYTFFEDEAILIKYIDYKNKKSEIERFFKERDSISYEQIDKIFDIISTDKN